jgi:hypothetical protein
MFQAGSRAHLSNKEQELCTILSTSPIRNRNLFPAVQVARKYNRPFTSI